MRIVCISDTHNCNEQINVPDGDLLIHSGDATINGSSAEIAAFDAWFSSLPHKHKIFVAGNHDWLFERDNALARSMLDDSVVYLQDSSVEIDGLKIYGSPWQPRFFDWAFNLMRGPELAEKWRLIPNDIDILITHGPPKGILDEVPRNWGIENTGCEELRKRMEQIAGSGRIKLHVFGHIHCGYGTHDEFGVKFVNASTCDEQYRPTQPPIVFDL
ncbi:MAG TPA: metallophosphatase domain-containing protein [Pyrinomonadaceae bacterium]|nr:metallophosphatase domain-containing protein [Pyrinomonadaceae bacterium]HMP66742.1 metallophosphatase domain-containing protein [Pyrinomonadaceae bacterium]